MATALPAGAPDVLPKAPAGVTPADPITTVAAAAGLGGPLDGAERKRFRVQTPDAAEGIARPDDRLEVVLIPVGARRRRPPRRARSTLRLDPTAVDITVATATVRDGEVVAWTTEMTR